MAGLDALNGLAESIEPRVAGMSTQSGLLEDFLLTTGGGLHARLVSCTPMESGRVAPIRILGT